MYQLGPNELIDIETTVTIVLERVKKDLPQMSSSGLDEEKVRQIVHDTLFDDTIEELADKLFQDLENEEIAQAVSPLLTEKLLSEYRQELINELAVTIARDELNVTDLEESISEKIADRMEITIRPEG
jgi:hypothetical protein